MMRTGTTSFGFGKNTASQITTSQTTIDKIDITTGSLALLARRHQDRPLHAAAFAEPSSG